MVDAVGAGRIQVWIYGSDPPPLHHSTYFVVPSDWYDMQLPSEAAMSLKIDEIP